MICNGEEDRKKTESKMMANSKRDEEEKVNGG